ncbi:MAG: SGNH/GDSL hydrolase family protein [Alphaproteobacteria bacterium]|nr:SGNH/GDSL hydrolase family protein [Alphaproteobacteria bacterium]
MHNRPNKKIIFWFVLSLIPVVFCLAVLEGWYAYGKWTFTSHFCSRFSQLDDEIGWTHKPNVSSCMGTHGKFIRSHVYHESPMFTDVNGFRSAEPGGESAKNAVMFIGDSHTFGYMVPYEDSFPGWYGRLTGQPVVNLASPAYSSAQAILMARRWVDELAPKALVYFDMGFWERGVCTGSARPTAILKPCYWVRPGQETELILPPAGHVRSMARFGLRPGGMVGAGEDTWSYFLISRPVSKIRQMFVRLGLASGMGNDFRSTAQDSKVVPHAVMLDLLTIAAHRKIPLVFVEARENYTEILNQIDPRLRKWLIFIDFPTWQGKIVEVAEHLPEGQFIVPHDGHYASGTYKLLAELIASRLPLQ